MKLFNIFVETVNAVGPSHRDWLIDRGVSRGTVWNGPACAGVARIETSGRIFEINPDGHPAVIVPISDNYDIDSFEDGLVDFLAFLPSNPLRWFALRDSSPVLNAGAVTKATILEKPLLIWRDPLSWLRADREGVVILDWRGDLRIWLSGASRIWCQDALTEQRLRKAFHLPVVIPEIRHGEVKNAA